jgi:hypothetical protein
MINFFKNRLLELLHKDTLDSYRVKVNNSNSLLYEMYQLLDDWKAGKIKQFETVQNSCDELLDSLKFDECFSYGEYEKQIVIDELEVLKKKTNEKELNLGFIHHILFHLIGLNKEKYLDRLFTEIDAGLKEDANQENFIKMDKLLNSFVAELIRIGYSKYFLYNISKKAFSEDNKFNDSFDVYKNRLLKKEKELFHIFFKLFFDKTDSIPSRLDLLSEIAANFISQKAKNTNRTFFVCDDKTRFLHFEEKVLDANTALMDAKLKLSTFLDKIHLTMDVVQIDVYKLTYITTATNSKKGNCKNTDYIVDGFIGKRNTFDKIESVLTSISNNIIISEDVKDRIYCSLRHFRLGNYARDLEEKFINYWIGLEYIFSSPEKDASTFTRIKLNLPIILLCGYMKRNFLYINAGVRVEKDQAGFANKELWNLDEEQIDTLIASSSSSLTKYRLSKIKSLVTGNSDKRKDYLKLHENHLNWHIVRLYRLRNELIHDAAIKNNIMQVTSNLRYYLVYTLNQILYYFSQIEGSDIKSKFNIDDFFYEYTLFYKNIKRNYDKNLIFSIPIELEIIN